MSAMNSHGLILRGWFVVVLLALEAVARAETGAAIGGDDEQTQRARELFQQGLQLSDQNRWPEAAQTFEQALAIRDAPSIRYNLAASLARIERFEEAANHAEAVLHNAETTPELRAQAEQVLTEIGGRLSRIEISLAGFETPPRVVLDGTLLNPDQSSWPVWRLPGHHVATAEQDGAEVARVETDSSAGAPQRMTLRPVPREVVTPPDGGEDDHPLVRDWRLWVGVGAAVAVTALAFGLAFGINPEPEDPLPGNMSPGVLQWP
jgi:hypothetical protein